MLKYLIKKLNSFNGLSSLDDKTIIEKLIQFRKNEAKDWQHTISNEEKTSIEKGKKDADNKKLNTHSSARKLYEKWL